MASGQLGLAKKRQLVVSSKRLQEGVTHQLSIMANEGEAHARKRQSGNVLDIVPGASPWKWWSTAFPKESAPAIPAAP